MHATIEFNEFILLQNMHVFVAILIICSMQEHLFLISYAWWIVETFFFVHWKPFHCLKWKHKKETFTSFMIQQSKDASIHNMCLLWKSDRKKKYILHSKYHHYHLKCHLWMNRWCIKCHSFAFFPIIVRSLEFTHNHESWLNNLAISLQQMQA